MENLLTKFRIKYSKLIMLKGLMDAPKTETLLRHKQLVDNYNQHVTQPEDRITDEELLNMEVKTNRQLRIHELVVEHSSEAALIVMSLPMPRKVQEMLSLSNYITFYSITYLIYFHFRINRKLYLHLYICHG